MGGADAEGDSSCHIFQTFPNLADFIPTHKSPSLPPSLLPLLRPAIEFFAPLARPLRPCTQAL